MTTDAIFDIEWDVIIIGGGMGGGAAAYQLTQHKKNVLLVEKGHSSFKKFGGVEVEGGGAEEKLETGRWPTKLTATVNGQKSEFWGPLGCGIGGSSLLYGAALQRLKQADFDKQQLPNGETIRWPFDYEELSNYYQQAETQFSVCGTLDPLEPDSNYTLKPPPVMCEVDQHFFQQFEVAGLNPYRLHVAIKYHPSCEECGGHICPRSCKQDSKNACIEPASASGYLTVLDDAEVIRIEASKTSVTGIQVKHQGQEKTLRAKQFMLAAGAYFTPIILQRSASVDWPQGLANGSGLVGKNLMFHAGDLLAFWPKEKYSREGYSKTIAFRDFYNSSSPKGGECQSTGLDAGYGNVLYALRLMFDQSRFRKIPLIRHFLRIPAYIASKLFGKATVFATIIEDFPYEENQVLIDESAPSGMRIEYTIHEEFSQRVKGVSKLIRKQLSNLRIYSMFSGMNLNYGHPCGTCKAGDDPSSSVVDKYCKAHELDNLYIADSSFMPTSGGTNPSLTIAANALRVADHVAQKLH
jgi:choline dehydrogenase-like flavoprotein